MLIIAVQNFLLTLFFFLSANTSGRSDEVTVAKKLLEASELQGYQVNQDAATLLYYGEN